MENDNKIITANGFQLVDSSGKVRALLTATENGVNLSFSDKTGKPQLKLATEDGLSEFTMYDETGKEKVGISLDDKGTHVHLAGAGKQETYLFLKNSGASGLVLTYTEGNRRIEAKLGPDGEPKVTIFPVNQEERSL